MTTKIVLKSGATFDIKNSRCEIIQDELGRAVNLKLHYVEQGEKPLYMDFAEVAAIFEIGSESSGG